MFPRQCKREAASNQHVTFAFPKSRRLRKRVEIVGVQRAGNAVHTRYFVVVCDVQGCGRLGITVSKKVGNAVNRNRVKRLVREFVRTARPLDGPDWLASELDVVVIAKKHAVSASTAQLWSDIASAQPAMAKMVAAEREREATS
ncbi:MAG: ribonuclease P protein component [Myxococcales bacterium]|nr:ribonuclease P protein component [Myxococcales bacterium]